MNLGRFRVNAPDRGFRFAAAAHRPGSHPLLTRGWEGPNKEPMTPLILRISVLAMAIGTCMAEDMTLPGNTVMRGDHTLVSLKAGTVVEVLQRGDKTISISYKGQAGTIPASSLTAASSPPAPSAAAAAKPAAPAAKTASNAPGSVVVDHPQSFYGNIVKKAETNIARHDETLVKPANEATDDTPSK